MENENVETLEAEVMPQRKEDMILSIQLAKLADGNFGKQTSNRISDALLTEVTDGEVEAYQIAAMAKCYAEAFSDLSKKLAAYLEERQQDKSYTAFGVQFDRAEVGTTYHYEEDDEAPKKGSGMKNWNMLKEDLDAVKAKMKTREDFLRKQGAVSKTSTSIIKMTLK